MKVAVSTALTGTEVQKEDLIREMKAKQSKNYLDYIPVKDPEIQDRAALLPSSSGERYQAGCLRQLCVAHH